MTDLNINVSVSVDKGEAETEPWNGEGVAGVVIKSEDERRYTLQVAYPANKPDVGVARDGHCDFASKEAVEEAAWNFLKDTPLVGLWHKDGTDGAGTVVESYIYRGPDWVVKAANGSEHTITAGDWLTGIIWDEPTWDDIKKGRIGGVSPQGTAERGVPTPAVMAGLRKRRG